MKPDFAQYGFQYPDNLIMAYLAGSATHGAKLGDKSDTDYAGIFIEPAVKVLGLEQDQHFVYTTSMGMGNTHEDTDVTLYSLRKWAGLAAKGNPSALQYLFANTVYQNGYWVDVVWNEALFVCKRHLGAFLGFANDQMKRLLGEKGQKNVNRPELESAHGYDTKYAMHVIRLFGEGKELMETGRLTYPRPDREDLIRIRQGAYTLGEIRDWSKTLESEALAARDKSYLPEEVNREAISYLLTGIYLQFWKGRNQ